MSDTEADSLLSEAPVGDFVIAHRPHLPGAVEKQLDKYTDEDKKILASAFEWTYNESNVVSIETAQQLAKPQHRMCGGKGYLFFSRVPTKQNNVFVDYLVMCDCALRNADKYN